MVVQISSLDVGLRLFVCLLLSCVAFRVASVCLSIEDMFVFWHFLCFWPRSLARFFLHSFSEMNGVGVTGMCAFVGLVCSAVEHGFGPRLGSNAYRGWRVFLWVVSKLKFFFVIFRVVLYLGFVVTKIENVLKFFWWPLA